MESSFLNITYDFRHNEIAIDHKKHIHAKITALAPAGMIKNYSNNSQSLQQIKIMTVFLFQSIDLYR